MDNQRHIPIRTCVGCRERDAQANLLRVVVADERVVADVRRRLPGRGAYVHRQLGCMDRALSRGGLARGLRARVGPADASALRQNAESVAKSE